MAKFIDLEADVTMEIASKAKEGKNEDKKDDGEN